MYANRSGFSSNSDAGTGGAVVAVLGGSSAFTPALARALANEAETLPPLEVRLHGRNEGRLCAVTRFCNRQAEDRGLQHRFSFTTSISKAAAGAEIIVNQMRIGGWPGRSHDERFPLDFGLPGDETIGPGGLASAVRGVPVVLEAAREAARVAPGAWFINLTNPMGILIAALQQVPELRSFGICELPGRVLERAAELLGIPSDQLEADYLGLNHQGWFVRLATEGRDVLPDLIHRIISTPGERFFRVAPQVMERIHALPLPYMRLYYHTAREVDLLKQKRASRGDQLSRLSARLYQWYDQSEQSALPKFIGQRDLPWIELALVPAISALLGGGERCLYISERNGSDIPGLPAGAIVEKRSVLGQNGAGMIPFDGPDPVSGGRLDRFLRMLGRLVRFEEAALFAALHREPDAIVAALCAHPLGIDKEAARAMVPLVLRDAGQ
jgi:6-phospho-beta-glucosidase